MRAKHIIRLVGALLFTLIVGIAMPISADDGVIELDPATISLSPGDSVVGDGLLLPDLIVESSNGNDILFLVENQYPVAYGSRLTATSDPVLNGCMLNGIGFADLGNANGQRFHQYDFSFVDGQTVDHFSVGVTDWADYLPYGTNSDAIYALSLIGYDATGSVIAMDTLSFTTNDSGFARTSVEYGPHFDGAGDACRAELGQPGNVIFEINAPGIAHAELRFKDQASMDPNIAIYFVGYSLEANNTPPVAEDDATSTTLNTMVAEFALGNDGDPDGDTITITNFQTPSVEGGQVTCTDGTCTYMPPFAFTGVDTFTYEICDPAGLCDTATVTIEVTNDATPAGCTKTQGYWKNHASGRKYDATWDQVNPDAAFYLSGETNLSIMTAPTKGHAYYILGQQFMAAEMNMRSGASIPDDVLSAFQQAQGMFEAMTPDEMGRKNSDAKMLADILDGYNNGLAGPGHCQ